MKRDIPSEPDDLVLVFLHRVVALAPGFSQALADQLEQEMRQQFGGTRVFIPKRKKHASPEQKQRAYEAGLSNLPTEEITKNHNISRATLYRLMKNGGAKVKP